MTIINTSVNSTIKSYLRSLKPEERQELMNTISQEEQTEAEELQKNPNITIERKMETVLEEIQELRNSIKVLNANANTTKNKPTCYYISNGYCVNPEDIQNEKHEEDTCLSFDWSNLIWIAIFTLLLSIIFPTKPKCPLII